MDTKDKIYIMELMQSTFLYMIRECDWDPVTNKNLREVLQKGQGYLEERVGNLQVNSKRV